MKIYLLGLIILLSNCQLDKTHTSKISSVEPIQNIELTDVKINVIDSLALAKVYDALSNKKDSSKFNTVYLQRLHEVENLIQTNRKNLWNSFTDYSHTNNIKSDEIIIIEKFGEGEVWYYTAYFVLKEKTRDCKLFKYDWNFGENILYEYGTCSFNEITNMVNNFKGENSINLLPSFSVILTQINDRNIEIDIIPFPSNSSIEKLEKLLPNSISRKH